MHPIDVLGQMTIEHDYFQYHVMLLLVLPNIISLFALELITLITALNDLISILMYFNYKVLCYKKWVIRMKTVLTENVFASFYQNVKNIIRQFVSSYTIIRPSYHCTRNQYFTHFYVFQSSLIQYMNYRDDKYLDRMKKARALLGPIIFSYSIC